MSIYNVFSFHDSLYTMHNMIIIKQSRNSYKFPLPLATDFLVYSCFMYHDDNIIMHYVQH